MWCFQIVYFVWPKVQKVNLKWYEIEKELQIPFQMMIFTRYIIQMINQLSNGHQSIYIVYIIK